MCQSVTSYEVDPIVHLIVSIKQLDGRDHFRQIAYPKDLHDTFDTLGINLV
jgi:hypothetical protein